VKLLEEMGFSKGQLIRILSIEDLIFVMIIYMSDAPQF